jgi:hypothetical protein
MGPGRRPHYLDDAAGKKPISPQANPVRPPEI